MFLKKLFLVFFWWRSSSPMNCFFMAYLSVSNKLGRLNLLLLFCLWKLLFYEASFFERSESSASSSSSLYDLSLYEFTNIFILAFSLYIFESKNCGLIWYVPLPNPKYFYSPIIIILIMHSLIILKWSMKPISHKILQWQVNQ